MVGWTVIALKRVRSCWFLLLVLSALWFRVFLFFNPKKGASVLESAACGVAEGSDGSSEESLHLMPEIQPTVALTHSNSACYLHQHLYRAGNSGFRRLIALCV